MVSAHTPARPSSPEPLQLGEPGLSWEDLHAPSGLARLLERFEAFLGARDETGLSLLHGERLVRGHVEERDNAFEIYDDAMMEGHGAYLLDQERPDIFRASVGNLNPGQAVELQIRYVTLARREGEATRAG